MFRICGDLDGDQVSATWTEGRGLEGDAALLSAAADLVASGAQVPVTPTGPSINASLEDGWSALVTLSHLLAYRRVEGDPPEPPAWFHMPPFDPDVIY